MILEAYPSLASLPRTDKIALIKELVSSMRLQSGAASVSDDYHSSQQAADDLTAIFHQGKKAAVERWTSFNEKSAQV